MKIIVARLRSLDGVVGPRRISRSLRHLLAASMSAGEET